MASASTSSRRAAQSILPVATRNTSSVLRVLPSSIGHSRPLTSPFVQPIRSTTRPQLDSLATYSASSTSSPSTPSTLSDTYPTASYHYRLGPLSKAEVAQYHRDGFIVKRQFYSEEEMRYLLAIAKSDRELGSNAIDVPDAGGRKSKLTVWNYLSDGEVPDDIYSAVGRGERMVGVMEQLLGDEVYHYHSKMMLKEPKVGGAWEWHQDYGYWYSNGVLAPRLASGLIAVDKATKANGCLQVLKGSHHYGRIEHGVSGGQAGADMNYVEAIARTCEKVHIECQPGDVLFFHCNLLHASAPNTSDHPRWSLICCYNARSNDPIRKSHHPNYHKLRKVDDGEVARVGREWMARRERGEMEEDEAVTERRRRAFLNPDDDESTPGSTRASSQ